MQGLKFPHVAGLDFPLRSNPKLTLAAAAEPHVETFQWHLQSTFPSLEISLAALLWDTESD